ncbi:protein FAM122A isoform X2 [Megalops cyprinoides]|uniref:protein FAM122A isoform X2 n=1 Tax=Megalops cyprinoides TaxID=118141 RepID=UPI001864ED18|nr:protein FAM122A isoform X2 [Megalops cyprinoides]
MERMEVDQCAGASGGGGALRRSNSAPMISGVSDGMTVFSSVSSARYRRSSMSVNPSCPGLALPLSPFSLVSERSDHQRQEESMELSVRGNFLRESASSLVPLPPVSPWHDHISLGVHSLDSGVTPNSSPSPTRRYRNRAAVSAAVRLPSLTPLKRKVLSPSSFHHRCCDHIAITVGFITGLNYSGGVESDAPPKKLFVAGVTDPPHLTGYTVSVSQASSSPPGGVSACATPQGSPLSLSPPPFTSHHHPSI